MEQPNALSDKLVLFIGIVFAVVIAESFARYSSLILHPSASLGFIGLLAVYLTVVSSWVRYHRKALQYPYIIESSWWWLRFGGDFIIVGLYAYLLYSLAPAHEEGNLVFYLWGFALIFFLYILVGILRRKEHNNPKASGLKQLFVLFFPLLVIAIVYQFVVQTLFPTVLAALNWLFLLVPPLLNALFTYRWWRTR
ncbi:MAG: hypothetical protein ACE5IE_01570 [Dehalococcoidia bacterium]